MADVTAIQRSAVASFLRARLNEEAQAGPAGNHPQQHRALHRLRQGGTHIGRWDPARVLADVQARSRVLDAYERALAMPDDDPGRPAEVGLGAGRCWRLPSRTGSTRTSTPPGTSDPRPRPSGSLWGSRS
jgi:hypothetical protein